MSESEAPQIASRPVWCDQLPECRLLTTTGESFNLPLNDTEDKHRAPLDRNNYFKSCHWSPDGTTLLTSNNDNILRTYVLPPDLLQTDQIQELKSYHEHASPGPVNATAFHPGYSLAQSTAAIYLASIPDLPTRLISPFSDKILATYPLINPNTEAYIAPHSLLFDPHSSNDTTHFFAGSDSQISIFDLNRPGSGPHTVLKTIPSKRNKLVGGGVGMKGLVSTIAVSPDGILAAGTFTRWIGLYDSGGRGSEVGVFQLGKDEGPDDEVGQGSGVTQLAWSHDGKYLVVAERMSDGISIWDVRGTGRRLAWLQGRNSRTLQRMSFDLVGDVVIAGDVQGKVRMWSQVGRTEGLVEGEQETKLHQDAISSVAMHPAAAVMATCSGQRRERIERPEHRHDQEMDDDDDSEGGFWQATDLEPSDDSQEIVGVDNSLAVWSLYSDIPGKDDK